MATERNDHRLLMVASWTHRVNREATRRVLEHCWQQVLEAVPSATLRIVGAGMDASAKAELQQYPNVDPVGFVDSLDEEYANCAFTICPIFEGAGTKIKVLESLRYGRTMVTTQHSLRGYEHLLIHRASILAVDRECELPDACIELLQKPMLRDRLASAGQRIVRAHYSFDAFSGAVAKTLAGLS